MSSVALAYGDMGEDEKALQWYGRVITIDPSLRSPLYNTAIILNRNKRYSEAIPHVQQLIKVQVLTLDRLHRSIVEPAI